MMNSFFDTGDDVLNTHLISTMRRLCDPKQSHSYSNAHSARVPILVGAHTPAKSVPIGIAVYCYESCANVGFGALGCQAGRRPVPPLHSQ